MTAARESHRAHGTHVKYVIDVCRCPECCEANRAYERARRARVVPPYVSAGPARAHVAELAEHGVGLKTIAKRSGVAHGTLWKLIYGVPSIGRPPSKRIRRATADKILAVTPADAADGARIDAAPSWVLLDAMIAAGVPKAQIANQLGQKGPGLQLARTTITARNARAVRDLHTAWVAGEWTPTRRDRWGNATPITAPSRPFRPAADVSELFLELAEIVEDRRAQADWRAQAACRNRPTHVWFPARGDDETLAAAIKVCKACLVRTECRAANLDQPDGVYAAMSARERRQIRLADEPAVKVAVRDLQPCGTNAAYHRHLRRNEEHCTDCVIAHRHYVQDTRPTRQVVA